MLNMFREGGFPMWFILLFGAIALGFAALAVARPERRRLRFVRGMIATTAASTLTGVAAALGAVFHHVPERFGDKPDWPLITMTGLGESMAPAIMGFSLVTLACLLAAVAAGRLRPEAA
jgi:hypothetical protein